MTSPTLKHVLVIVVAVSAARLELAADLIAHYTFDEGEPFDEVGVYDGTAKGDAVSDGPGVGPEGLAFRFSGAGNIEIPIDVSPTNYPELTVTMWVKADPNIPNAPGLYKTFGHDNGGWDRTFGLDNRNGPYRWGAFIGTAPGITQDTGTPVTSEWTFLAAVWNSEDVTGPTVRLHANENYIVEPLVDTAGFATASIGSLRPDNFNEGWRGLIDEVQIHDEALSIEDIEAIRAEVPPPEANAPVVTTLDAVGFGEGTATLQGIVNPNGLASTSWFEWGPTVDYGNSTPEVDVGASFADVAVAADLAGLDVGATYHFRAVARNASGTTFGEDAMFVLPDPNAPIVYYSFDDGQATDESGNGRDGLVEGDALSVSPGIGDAGEAFQFLGQGQIDVPLNINPSVYPDLTVTMWVKAADGIPAAPGLYKTFGHDDGGWDRTFGLDRRVPDGDFRWAAFTGGGVTPSTGTPVTSEWTFLAAVWDTADDGTATVRFHANANNITAPLTNTNGHARVAIGSLRPDNFNEGWQGLIDEVKIFGSALTVEEVEGIRAEFSEDESGPPEATTLAATAIGPGTATLNGRVVPNGAATTARFEYGATTDYGMTTADIDVGAGFGAVSVDAVLDGLDEDGTYHFRLVATNANGTSEGGDESFDLGLLAHYTFEGGDATDASGKENHGIPEGDAAPAASDREGDEDGEAFQFSGGGHIVVPLDLNPTRYPDLTVTMWVKADEAVPDTSGLYKTFGHDDGGWDRTFGLDNRQPDGEFRWAAFTGGAGPGPTQNTGEPVTSEWTFLAAVWDTGENGAATVRFHTNELSIVEPLTNTNGLTTAAIGSLRPDNFNEGWRGLIDDARIFGKALTEDEIAAIRDGGAPPPPPRLIPGNVNGDAAYNISDPVAHLDFLFSAGELLECYVVPGSDPVALSEAGLAILDFNGDGDSNITDAVGSLNFLFGGGAPPAIGRDCVEVEGGCQDQCP